MGVDQLEQRAGFGRGDLTGSHALHQGMGRACQICRPVDRRQDKGEGPISADGQQPVQSKPQRRAVSVQRQFVCLAEQGFRLALEIGLKGECRAVAAALGTTGGVAAAARLELSFVLRCHGHPGRAACKRQVKDRLDA